MKSEIYKSLQKIAKRYEKHGITYVEVKEIYTSGLTNGFTENQAIIGIRLALSKQFSEREYFTSQDVAEFTGETVEEINSRICENEEELFKNGHITKVSSPFLN